MLKQLFMLNLMFLRISIVKLIEIKYNKVSEQDKE